MSTILNINSNDSIGNTLSSVNTNYLNLENDVLSIQNDIKTYWNPVYNYYKAFGKLLKETSSIAQAYSSVIINTCTTVESNSSAWLKPITIFYPSIFPYTVDSEDMQDTIEVWIKEYFPESSYSQYDENTDTFTLIPNYVENQEIIVYAHLWKFGTSISENTLIADYTLCKTNNRDVCAYCTQWYSGLVYCSNGNFNCGGSTSCQSCGTLKCSYLSPPYNSYVPPPKKVLQQVQHYTTKPVQTVTPIYNKKGKVKKNIITTTLQRISTWFTTEWVTVGGVTTTNDQNKYGSIAANVQMNFQDRYENPNIFSIVFKIKNCSWTFDRFIYKF